MEKHELPKWRSVRHNHQHSRRLRHCRRSKLRDNRWREDNRLRSRSNREYTRIAVLDQINSLIRRFFVVGVKQIVVSPVNVAAVKILSRRAVIVVKRNQNWQRDRKVEVPGPKCSRNAPRTFTQKFCGRMRCERI